MTTKVYATTPAQFAAAQDRLKAQGYDASEPSGTLSAHGVTLQYAFDGVGHTAVTIEHKPGLLSADLVWSKCDAWFQEV